MIKKLTHSPRDEVDDFGTYFHKISVQATRASWKALNRQAAGTTQIAQQSQLPIEPLCGDP
jgi:hypothetical protein